MKPTIFVYAADANPAGVTKLYEMLHDEWEHQGGRIQEEPENHADYQLRIFTRAQLYQSIAHGKITSDTFSLMKELARAGGIVYLWTEDGRIYRGGLLKALEFSPVFPKGQPSLAEKYAGASLDELRERQLIDMVTHDLLVLNDRSKLERKGDTTFIRQPNPFRFFYVANAENPDHAVEVIANDANRFLGVGVGINLSSNVVYQNQYLLEHIDQSTGEVMTVTPLFYVPKSVLMELVQLNEFVDSFSFFSKHYQLSNISVEPKINSETLDVIKDSISTYLEDTNGRPVRPRDVWPRIEANSGGLMPDVKFCIMQSNGSTLISEPLEWKFVLNMGKKVSLLRQEQNTSNNVSIAPGM